MVVNNVGATTLSIMIFSIITLTIMILSRMARRIRALSKIVLTQLHLA